MCRFVVTDMGHISLIFGMQDTRNRENGTLTISQADYTMSACARTVRNRECKPVSTPGAGKELSLDEAEGNFLANIRQSHVRKCTWLK